ncbi:conserved hypothetical protein [Ricinus communis]|uniref:Uncharacterized protein n=1 Tax=Ricinus communis TaxID=3988 RepID=B9RKL2_RICCO|nr:conserved hypothetical protein [Ricinus communis]
MGLLNPALLPDKAEEMSSTFLNPICNTPGTKLAKQDDYFHMTARVEVPAQECHPAQNKNCLGKYLENIRHYLIFNKSTRLLPALNYRTEKSPYF